MTILPDRPKRSDPPDLSYGRYEIWGKVRKESHTIGGRDLEWKSGVVDLKIEADLLDDYLGWVRAVRHDLRVEGKIIKNGAIHHGKEYKKVIRRIANSSQNWRKR